MEAELRNDFEGMDVELVEGEFGAFNVLLDGVLVFSKKEGSCCHDRFPNPGEITGIIKKLGGSGTKG